MLKNLKQGGTFLLNTDMDDTTLVKMIPNRVKYQLATKGAKFYVIDANKIAGEIGMGRHTNTILQASFFYLNQDIMPYDDANHWMKNQPLDEEIRRKVLRQERSRRRRNELESH